MKGAGRTKAEKEFQDRIAKVGCIACLHDGRFNPYVSLHHIAGRTAPGAHMKVIPLCAPHHQDQGIEGVHAVHPWKWRFEQEYGRQMDLLEEVKQIAGISSN